MKWLKIFIVVPVLLAWLGAAPVNELTRKQDPTEGNIAKLLSRVLEQAQFSHQPFNNDMACRFLDRYIDTLDNQHLNFLQSDIEEFQAFSTTLDELTKAGNTGPAHTIYNRFLHRVEQRVQFVTDLVKSEKLTFTDSEHYVLDRKKEAFPKDLNQAQQLWRQRVRFEYLQELLNNKKPDQIVNSITKRYNSLLRTAQEMKGDDVAEAYLTALANAYDPHSVYLGHEQFENLNISMKLSLVGIGVELVVEDGYPMVNRVMPGPAARSKQIKTGDRLVAVSQDGKSSTDVQDMPLNKVVELIRGPKGSSLHLTFIPADAQDPSVRKKVSLVREEIKLEDQEAKAKIVEVAGEDGKTRRLGIIDLPSFYEDMEARKWLSSHKSTTEDVAKLLKKLNEENISGLILDLRQNGGGSLQEAIGFTSLFIKKGPVVQVKDSKGKVSVYVDKRRSPGYDGPMVVLTSRGSASASEIVAGALQDYGRALIVGDPSTYGKGTVQSVLQLEPLMKQFRYSSSYDPGGLVVTIEKFYRPGGSSTQLKGVEADIVIPSMTSQAETGEAALANPLGWDSIRPAEFEMLNRTQPYVQELKKRSAHRVEQSEEFSLLRGEITRYRDFMAKNTVSLNEEQRRKEKAETKNRLAGKLERRSQTDTSAKVFEITLRNANQPGLPPPIGKTNAMATPPRPAFEDSGSADFFHDDEKGKADITMNEAQKVLLDYLNLLQTK
ncbi:MAG: peptidase [Verrucomicrobiales bacterium]|nr:peptidase [Verrucomicrobiales bacterium]